MSQKTSPKTCIYFRNMLSASSPIFFQCSDRTVDMLTTHNGCSKRHLPYRDGQPIGCQDGRGKTQHVLSACPETDANAKDVPVFDMPYQLLNKDDVNTNAVTCRMASHQRRASNRHNMCNVTWNAHVYSMKTHNGLCTCWAGCLHKLRNNIWQKYGHLVCLR